MNYRDHSAEEIAAMSLEDFTKTFLPYELMKAGIEDVKQPKLINVPTVPEKDYHLWSVEYRTGTYSSDTFNCYFPTFEDAKAFCALKPLYMDYRENVVKGGAYALNELTIYSPEIKEKCQGLLNDTEKIKESNKEKQRIFNEKWEKISKIRSSMFDVWQEICNTADLHARIKETYEKYLKMCGTEEVAMSFLGEVFKVGDIEAAMKKEEK